MRRRRDVSREGRGKKPLPILLVRRAVPSLRSLKFESDLRHALEREEFVLLYQPKKDIATARSPGWRLSCDGATRIRDIGVGQFPSARRGTGLMIRSANGRWRPRAGKMSLSERESRICASRRYIATSVVEQGSAWRHRGRASSSGMSAELLELEISESALLRDMSGQMICSSP